MAVSCSDKRETVKAAVCHFIESELCEDLMKVESETSFESLGIDSIFLMEIVLFLERECQVEVRSDMLRPEALTSVDTLVDAVLVRE